MKRNKPLKRRTPLKSFSQLRTKVQLRTKKGLTKSGPLLRRTKLKQVSKKRRKEGAEYSKLRKEFLAEHPRCEVCLCRTAVERVDVKPATEVHHKGGRGALYLRTDTWLAVCHDHHELITKSRKWAEGCGFSLTVEQRRKLL